MAASHPFNLNYSEQTGARSNSMLSSCTSSLSGDREIDTEYKSDIDYPELPIVQYISTTLWDALFWELCQIKSVFYTPVTWFTWSSSTNQDLCNQNQGNHNSTSMSTRSLQAPEISICHHRWYISYCLGIHVSQCSRITDIQLYWQTGPEMLPLCMPHLLMLNSLR